MTENLKEWTLTALEGARRLEKEGFLFYTKAGFKTQNQKGREMFDFLAVEEAKHYKIVDNMVKTFGGQTKILEEEAAEESGVFAEARGGRLDEKSDNLDALNIGIQAEHKSIELYTSIHDKTDSKELKKAMKKLIQEEKKHLSILETEAEFITETGEWHDFRTVSM
ncbi:MAG: hypothetical protein FJY77_03160 [Candidatus Altiarchaeales archaeon]|nr:hypothetical protein [Candidatus Altiarchaeales archaeon]